MSDLTSTQDVPFMFRGDGTNYRIWKKRLAGMLATKGFPDDILKATGIASMTAVIRNASKGITRLAALGHIYKCLDEEHMLRVVDADSPFEAITILDSEYESRESYNLL